MGLGAVCVLVLAGLAALLLLGDSGSDHPDEWDPRVTDLVAFVEDERELEFDHPVHIDFLTPEEYSDAARADEAELTDEDRAAIEDDEAVLRALGLLEDDVDLFESSNELSDGGTLAYYDDATDRITVRGTEMTVDLEGTLVHELTHALQDQHFDLGRLYEFEDTGQSSVFRAVVEGDASLVEEAYVGSLDEDDLDDYLATVDEQVEQAPFEEVPSILTASFGAPYALGTPFVGIVEADGGWEAVNEMLGAPPASEVELLDPERWFEPTELEDVELPPADDDVEVIDESDFGSISLYLMLAARMDAHVAFDAARGWAGDAYRTTRDDGTVCVELEVVGADDEASEAIGEALDAWADGTDADVSRDGGRTTLTSCDPGTDGLSAPVTDPLDAIALPTSRSYSMYGTMLQLGATPEEGACVGDLVVTQLPLEVLAVPDPTDEQLDQYVDAMTSAGQKCGVL